MNYIGTTDDGIEVYMGDNIIVLKDKNGSGMRITPEETYVIDRYGNEMSIAEMNMCLKPNAPTYDELYEYWLKTK